MALDNPSYFSIANPPPLCSLSSSLSSTSSCSSPRSQTKRSLRSLLRSLSTNSADSNHELFNTGAPRLSDIAPEFKHPLESAPRRANSLKARRHTSHRRSGGLYAALSQDDRVDNDDDDEEEVAHDEDEVFIAHEDDDAVRCYYNVKSSPARRHSLSALRTRTTTTASTSSTTGGSQQHLAIVADVDVSDGIDNRRHNSDERDSPAIDDHKLRHGSYPRKRCTRCPKGVTKRADMDDILIVSAKESEPANLWAQYFASYFEQISQNANRKPYRIRHLGVEEVISANAADVRLIAERTTSVKLQLVIICPLFLEKIQDNQQACAEGLGKLLFPDRILALQLGTADEDVGDAHKDALPGYQQWQRRPVGQDQDQNFALEFVASAIAIFTKVWKQQSSIASEENSQFSIAPKKIRAGQTSVLVLLEYPLQHEDIVKISVVKNEELTEIKNVKRRNPYTLKFTVPERFLEVSAIVNILVEKNGSFIGRRPIKCESRLRELEQILRSTSNPVEFMCQSLGFSPHDTEQLDNWLVHMFQKNVPPNFALFANDSTPNNKHVCELFPTLLHFSARFGLEKLTSQLLDCPGGDLACDIRNVQDFTPADIAENMGHKEINNMLRGYMKMNELAVVYTKIKKLTSDNATASLNDIWVNPDDHYLVPQDLQMDDFYKMCPAPRPLALQVKSADQYITMDQNASEKHDVVRPTSTSQQYYQNLQPHDEQLVPNDSLQSKLQVQQAPNKQSKQRHHQSLQSIQSKNSNSSKSASSAVVITEDKVQVELLEIINDFKNNVHTIAQTEQLVAEWQNRNDVQKSFREKQEQLQELRERYERIQRDLKRACRKAGPFERFKKMFGFTRGSQQSLAKDEAEVKATPATNECSNQVRPISSLSLQSTTSSTSSGRMSTISGCSFGDSGTHSDHEERKIVLTPTDDEFKEFKPPSMASFHNYLIPPAPRPVKIPLMMSQSFPTIEERTGREFDTFYIQFPPNGLPVTTASTEMLNTAPKKESCNFNDEIKTEQTIQQQEYMNFPAGCSTSIDKQELNHAQHDYMNFKAVSP